MDIGEGSWSPYRFQALRMFSTLVICCDMLSQRVVVDLFIINYAIINFRQQMTEERVWDLCPEKWWTSCNANATFQRNMQVTKLCYIEHVYYTKRLTARIWFHLSFTLKFRLELSARNNQSIVNHPFDGIYRASQLLDTINWLKCPLLMWNLLASLRLYLFSSTR